MNRQTRAQLFVDAINDPRLVKDAQRRFWKEHQTTFTKIQADLSRLLGLPNGSKLIFNDIDDMISFSDKWIGRCQEDAMCFAARVVSRRDFPLDNVPPIKYIKSENPQGVTRYGPSDGSYAIGVDFGYAMCLWRVLPVVQHALTVPEDQRSLALGLLLALLVSGGKCAGRQDWIDDMQVEKAVYPLYLHPPNEATALVKRGLNFIVAHELGHIALGHVGPDCSSKSQDIEGRPASLDISAFSQRKQEEFDADRWAANILMVIYGEKDEAARGAPETFLRVWSLIERHRKPLGITAELKSSSHPPFATRAELLRKTPIPKKFDDCYQYANSIMGIPILLNAMQRNAYIQVLMSMRDGKAVKRLPSSIADGEVSKTENSYSETCKLCCPKCGVEYQARLWLLIDVRERPDLFLAAAKGDLHRVACPDGHSGALDLPLLTYVQGFKPRIFISGRLASDHEEAADDNTRLMKVLMNKIGPDVEPNWNRDDLYAIMPGQRQTVLLGVAHCLSQLTEINQQKRGAPSQSPVEARRIDFLNLETKEDLEKYLLILTYAPNLWKKVRAGNKVDIRKLISRGRHSDELGIFRELIAFLNDEKQESELSDVTSWLAGGLADILYASIQGNAKLFKEHIPMLGPHQRLYTLLVLILFEEPIIGIPMYINNPEFAGKRLLSCSRKPT